jgi:hypothetical protein
VRETHTNGYADGRYYCYRDGYGNTKSDCDTYCYAGCYSDRNTDADFNRNSNVHTYTCC